ncbi:hypothetical protein AYL99_09457 [Fonsecaea erecta]|uniref:Uncharacterized protein n=1 Tax=Fonsecaea erecta TaxID=1367422 RepID=A0A178Z913_9EURO|nr:hypothetical protein AYL99_09457 [Fonsecaea erecta]OAP56278.1 hypothetical protein AYL99_09457 [Fonsecaea erecta]
MSELHIHGRVASSLAKTTLRREDFFLSPDAAASTQDEGGVSGAFDEGVAGLAYMKTDRDFAGNLQSFMIWLPRFITPTADIDDVSIPGKHTLPGTGSHVLRRCTTMDPTTRLLCDDFVSDLLCFENDSKKPGYALIDQCFSGICDTALDNDEKYRTLLRSQDEGPIQFLLAIVPLIAGMVSATPVAEPSPMEPQALSGLVERQGLLGSLLGSLGAETGILLTGLGVYEVSVEGAIVNITQTLGIFL